MSLNNKRVLVIGGSAGIGKATARAVVVAGGRVVIASRSKEHLEAAREELGADVETCVLDVRDVRGMDACLEDLGRFDHLVITAVETRASSFMETDLDDARKVMETKFWGAFAAVQLSLPRLSSDGSVTLFSGIAAHRPVRGLSVSAAANAAIEGLTRSLALELSPLRVNAIAPGVVDTHGLDPERRDALAASLPVQHVGGPEEVAHAVLFLMENSYVTGTVLHVDGGKPIS